jgi:hypothetical protein
VRKLAVGGRPQIERRDRHRSPLRGGLGDDQSGVRRGASREAALVHGVQREAGAPLIAGRADLLRRLLRLPLLRV